MKIRILKLRKPMLALSIFLSFMMILSTTAFSDTSSTDSGFDDSEAQVDQPASPDTPSEDPGSDDSQIPVDQVDSLVDPESVPGPDGSKVPVPQTMLFTGAATQSIPIVVPPGRNGIGPNLTLTYNSYQKNGWIGVGWRLEMGAIQRSTKHGLKYDGDDYVASLNGNTSELVRIGTSDYYKAKIEGAFTQYQYDETAKVWTVTTKDGTVYTYGGTAASRQSDPTDPNNRISKWCLSRVEDPNGNYMAITYDKSYGDNEIYLERIEYTGNGSLLPVYRVEFLLGSRSDTPERYDSHFQVKTTRRLSEINIYGPPDDESIELIRSYELAYNASPNTERSLLASVQQVGKEGNSLPPVTFTYQQGGKLFFYDTYTFPNTVAYTDTPEKVYAADVNGDKKTDMLLGPDSSGNFKVLLNTVYAGGTNGFNEQQWSTGYSGYDSEPGKVQILDITGDGLADVVLGPDDDGYFHYFRSTGSSFTYGGCLNQSTPLPGTFYPYPDFMRPMDINGDGKMDLVCGPIEMGDLNHHSTYFVLLTTENLGVIQFDITQHYVDDGDQVGIYEKHQVRSMDVNGDGYSDLLLGPSDSGIFEVWESDGVSSFNVNTGYGSTLNFGAYNGNAGRFKPADVNGDGLQDIVYILGGGDLGVILNTGESFEDDGTWYVDQDGWDHLHDHSYRVHTPDVNGDGLADVVLQGGPNWKVLRSTGSSTNGFVHQLNLNDYDYWTYADQTGNLFDDAGSAQSWQRRIVESNGDGLQDIVLGPGGGSGLFVELRTGGSETDIPDLLEKVENGYGAYTEIGYTSSTLYPGTEHEKLPFIVQTASSITIHDGMVGTPGYLTNYSYLNPDFDNENREFLGFAEALQINPDNSKVETFFHQDEYRKGRQETVNLYSTDNPTSPFGITSFTWTDPEVTGPDADGSLFVKLESKTVDFAQDGVSTTETYSYIPDQGPIHGGIESKTVSGNNAPSVTTEYDWVNNGTWMWRLSEERLLDPDDPEGWIRRTGYGYNANGNPIEKRYYLTDSQYESETFVYDSYGYGNPTGGLNPRGYQKPTIVYDTVTQIYPVSMTNALGHNVTKDYDYGFGKVTSERDPNNEWTHYIYDEFGRIERVYTTEDSENGTIVADANTYYHDDATPRYVVQSVKESSTSTIDSYTFLDGLGRPLLNAARGEDGKAIVSYKYYDNMSRNDRTDGPYFVGSVSFPLSDSNYSSLLPPADSYSHPWIETDYDERGRPETITSPDKSGDGRSERLNTVTYAYNGLQTTVTDPDTGSKTEKTDFLGRVIEVTEHADTVNHVTYYEYNIAGDLEKVTDALGNETGNTYDKLGRKENMTDPDMGFWQYTYDGNGNLLTQTDAEGRVIQFTYDVIDRVTLKQYVNTTDPDVHYEYDSALITNGTGRLYSTTKVKIPQDPISETVYNGYDALGQVTSVTKSIQNGSGILDSYTTDYEYDMSGKTTLIVYPDTSEVGYTYYGGTNLLHQVLLPDGQGGMDEHAEFSSYEPSGKIGAIDYWQNGVYTHYTYDQASGRLLDLVTTEGTTTIQEKSYVYSQAGDIEQITDSKLGVTHTYTYDKLHRLTGETSDAAVSEYAAATIEPLYPQTGETQSGGVKYPIHAAKSAASNGITKDYRYDRNGNMTVGWDFSDPLNPVERTFSYDADNMPVEIVHETKGTTQYYYDGAGRRVKKVAPGGTTYYIGDHYEVKDSVATKFVFAGNIRLAMIDNTGIYYYHKDHLGSTAAMTKASTSAIQPFSEADYLPFGGERTSDTHTLTNYAFTDQERDPESGLYNYNARLYDPVIGQFITPDSIVLDLFDPQTLNRYSYCRNNPLIYVDPSGHDFGLVSGMVIGAIIGGVTSAATDGDVLEGMLTGAISGAIFWGAGEIIEIAEVTQKFAQAVIHFGAGVTSGGINAGITGGDVGLGMVTGGISGGIANYAGSFLSPRIEIQFVGRSIIGGVTGGIAAEIYGGNFSDGFAQGAMTSAIGFTCNHMLHSQKYLKYLHKAWNSVKSHFKGVKVGGVILTEDIQIELYSKENGAFSGKGEVSFSTDLIGIGYRIEFGDLWALDRFLKIFGDSAINLGPSKYLGVSYVPGTGAGSINIGVGIGSPIGVSKKIDDISVVPE